MNQSVNPRGSTPQFPGPRVDSKGVRRRPPWSPIKRGQELENYLQWREHVAEVNLARLQGITEPTPEERAARLRRSNKRWAQHPGNPAYRGPVSTVM